MQFLKKLRNFTSKPKTLLGFDIDHYSCKFIELSETANSYQVHTCVQTFFTDANLIQPFNWSNAGFLACLKRVVQEGNFSTHQVALALSQAAVLFKTIELDKRLQDTEVMIQVKDKITQYFNHSITDLLVDFEILGISKNHPDLNEIRYVAAKLPEVELRIRALESAHLRTIFVEVESYTLQRVANFFLQRKYPNFDSVMVVYITTKYLLLLALEGQLITHINMENISTDHEDLAILIRDNLLFFLKDNTDKQLKLILLCGLHVSIEFSQRIESQIQIKTAILDIFSEFDCSHVQSACTDDFYSKKSIYKSAEFAIAAGLAMRVAA